MIFPLAFPRFVFYHDDENRNLEESMALPELLAPAGGMSQLKAALRFGADAVYGALPQFGLRAFAGNFTWEELRQALSLVHARGKKFILP